VARGTPSLSKPGAIRWVAPCSRLSGKEHGSNSDAGQSHGSPIDHFGDIRVKGERIE